MEGYWRVKVNISADAAEYVTHDRAMTLAEELQSEGWRESACKFVRRQKQPAVFSLTPIHNVSIGQESRVAKREDDQRHWFLNQASVNISHKLERTCLSLRRNEAIARDMRSKRRRHIMLIAHGERLERANLAGSAPFRRPLLRGNGLCGLVTCHARRIAAS